MVYKNLIMLIIQESSMFMESFKYCTLMLLMFHHFIQVMDRSILCASLDVQEKLLFIIVTPICLKHHYCLLMNIFYHLSTIIMPVISLVLLIELPSMVLRCIWTTYHNKTLKFGCQSLWEIPFYCLWKFLIRWLKRKRICCKLYEIYNMMYNPTHKVIKLPQFRSKSIKFGNVYSVYTHSCNSEWLQDTS